MGEKAPFLDYPVVILAAGEGTRLRRERDDLPKPLTPVLGLTLLERALLSWAEAGARRFYVVVGWKGDWVATHAREVARRYSLDLEVVDNPHWEEGNGTSVLAVRDRITSPFFVSMVDHIFQPPLVEGFVQQVMGKTSTTMAVDPRVTRVFDLADATKVRLEGDRVVDIGKEILPYRAVDMGLFLFSPEIFQALEEARCRGDGSLTGGVKRLVSQGKVEVVKLEEGFWTDVDTPQGLEYAKKGLLACVASSRDEGWISRHLNRHLSRRITARLASTSLTPNHITFMAFLLAVTGGCLFALGKLGTTLLAAFLVQAASVLDGCDGEVARLKFMSTPWGAWWDTLLDRYADGAMVLGITWGYSHGHKGTWPWILGLLSLLAFVLVSYAKKEYALRFGHFPHGDAGDKLTRRDLRLFAIFLGGLANRPFPAMMTVGLLSHLWIGWVLWEKRKGKV